MSNHLVSTTYKRKLGSNLRKSLMAILADKASDDGSGIYASKQTIADELDCSKRAVIETIKAFIADGLLEEIGHRQVTNGYTVEYGIRVDALEALPLANCHAERERRKKDRCATVTGEPHAPVNEVHVRGEPGAPKPPLNQSSPKASPSTKTRASKSRFVLPADIPTDEWRDFEEMRRAARKPMTDAARTKAVARLRKLAEDGWPPGDVLSHSTLNNYQGLFPPKDNRNGTYNGRYGPTDGLGPTARAALRAIGGGLGQGQRPQPPPRPG